MQHIGQTFEQAVATATTYTRLNLAHRIDRQIVTVNGIKFYTWIVVFTN